MATAEVTEIVCAHSPDSDDAFMFYALATRKVRSPLLNFKHVLADIETLNRKAQEGAYELTAISYHAYPYVADQYVLMASGSSVGDGYGPMLISLRPFGPDEVKGKRIAVRTGDPRSPVDLRQRRFPPDPRPGALVEDPDRITPTFGG
jgi:1,4-dihydroxy-6-naphthoate synthase